jgi:hypothetical protein
VGRVQLKSSIPLILALCLLPLLAGNDKAMSAEAFVLPDQKLLVALPVINYSRETFSRSDSGSIPVGFAAEYSLFLTNSSTIFTQFEINLDSATQSVAFIGGGAGMSWYLIGGSNIKHEGTFIESIAKPKQDLYVGLGLASRSFDFLIKDTDQSDSAKIQQKDKKDNPTGSFIGAMVFLAYEYPFYYDLLPGIRFQYIKSFTSETSPDFTITEIWLSVGFVF